MLSLRNQSISQAIKHVYAEPYVAAISKVMYRIRYEKKQSTEFIKYLTTFKISLYTLLVKYSADMQTRKASFSPHRSIITTKENLLMFIR